LDLGESVILFRSCLGAECWWLTPIVLATQEAEIRRIEVQSQPRRIVCETLSRKKKKKKLSGRMKV
jgi:hypothetical protein